MVFGAINLAELHDCSLQALNPLIIAYGKLLTPWFVV